MKKFNNKFGFLGWLLLISLIAMGARISDNILRIGDKTGSDIELQMGDGRLKWDDTASVLQFSNDQGSLFKDIGSGSGAGQGGVNILANPSYEDGVGSPEWVASGVTPTQVAFAEPAPNNENHARVDFSAGSQFFESASTNKPDSLGSGCSAQFKYNGGDANIDVVIIDGSSNELFRSTLVARTDWGAISPIQFPCASAMKIRFESTADAAVFDVDEVYLGSTLGLSNLANVEVAGKAFFAETASCLWSNTGATLDDFGTDADCPGPTIVEENVGSWQTTDADLPQITINSLPAGKYEVIVDTSFGGPATGGAGNALRVTDGSTNGQNCGLTNDSASSSHVTCRLLVTYSSIGSRTFKLQSQTSSGSVFIDNGTSTQNNLTFTVIRYAPESQATFLPETEKFFVDANIGGANLTHSSSSTPVELTNAGLNLVVNLGSAEIPCSATNPSTGLTCSAGSESIGIVVDVPSAGEYKYCFSFGVASGSTSAGYRLVETPNNAQTILQQGNSFATNLNASVESSVRLCDTFNFGTSGQKTVRMFHEAGGTGSLLLDRSATVYERDMHISVEKVSQHVPAPVLVGGQYRSGDLSEPQTKVYRAMFGGATDIDNCSSDPCTVHLEKGGDWISVVNRASTGLYDLTTNAVFKANELVNCFISAFSNGSGSTTLSHFVNTGAGARNDFKANGSGVINFNDIFTTDTAGTAKDTIVNLVCYGEE